MGSAHVRVAGKAPGARAGLRVEDLNVGIPRAAHRPVLVTVMENRSTHLHIWPPEPQPGGDVGNVSAEQKAMGHGCNLNRQVHSPVLPVGGLRRRQPQGPLGLTAPPPNAILDVGDGAETAPSLPKVPVPNAGTFR